MKGPTEVSLRVSVRMQIHIGYLFTLRNFTDTEEIPSEILRDTRQRLPKFISQCSHTQRQGNSLKFITLGVYLLKALTSET